MDVRTKSEFANLCNVSAARVSQWIGEGKISGNALIGEGRKARVNVEIALQQVGIRRDVGQAFGNGLKTRLDLGDEFPNHNKDINFHSSAAIANNAQEKIVIEKLRQSQITTAQLERKEKEYRGEYIKADELQVSVNKAVSLAMRVMDSALQDMAMKLSSEFEINNRDALSVLKGCWKATRQNASEKYTEIQDCVNELIEDTQDIESFGNPDNLV